VENLLTHAWFFEHVDWKYILYIIRVFTGTYPVQSTMSFEIARHVKLHVTWSVNSASVWELKDASMEREIGEDFLISRSQKRSLSFIIAFPE
jgi:hypothetical protein